MKAQPLVVYLPDRRDVEVSRFGCGNNKIGPGIFTYSRLAGAGGGTCPGSTTECESICYAKRINGPVKDIYARNSSPTWDTRDNLVPPIPDECQILRIHVSGDFDSVAYINAWIDRLAQRPDVTCWAYTRSWRVSELLPTLEQLRRLPNVQLFASMDASTKELPPTGWRRAWIWRDRPKPRIVAHEGPGWCETDVIATWPVEHRLDLYRVAIRTVPEAYNETYRLRDAMTRCNLDRTPSYICPEETGRKKNCLECGYCFEGQKHDVTFLEH